MFHKVRQELHPEIQWEDSCGVDGIGKFIKGLSIISGAVSSGMAVFDLLAIAIC